MLPFALLSIFVPRSKAVFSPSRARLLTFFLFLDERTNLTENASETDHPRRLRRRENVADESIREQKIFEAIQSHHRGGFPHERSESGRQFGHHANMGHGWTREIPIARRGILQRRGLLRVSVRREQREELSKPGKLEGGVSRAGVAVGPGELSVYRFRKQNRPRRRTIESGVGEESVVLLRGEWERVPTF